MTHVDSILKGRSVLEVPISVHHYPTDSEFGRYQILLDGITILHFDKRFPGPATQISTKGTFPGGPSSRTEVDVYQTGDLLPEERLALGLELR